MPESMPRSPRARGAPARTSMLPAEPHTHPLPDRPYHCIPIDELADALEAARVAADHMCRPALDHRRIQAMGKAFRRPYHDLDDLALEALEAAEAAEAGWPEENRVRPSPLHAAICNDLEGALAVRYEDRGDAFAASEMDLYYNAADRRTGCVTPDFMVVFGAPKVVAGPEPYRRIYTMWRDHDREPPSFVLEMLSPSTWERDMGLKREIYADIGVRDYFVFDTGHHVTPRLQGFRPPGGSGPSLPSEALPGGMRGVYSEALGLYLCHEEPWPPKGQHPEGIARVRWYDPAADEYLETPLEIARRAADEARREEAEARGRVEAANEEAAAERQRAEAEAKARRAAESRIAELEARIRDLAP